MSWLSLALLFLRLANAILGEVKHRRSFKAGQRDILDKIDAETLKLAQRANTARQNTRNEHSGLNDTDRLPDDGFRRD